MTPVTVQTEGNQLPTVGLCNNCSCLNLRALSKCQLQCTLKSLRFRRNQIPRLNASGWHETIDFNFLRDVKECIWLRSLSQDYEGIHSLIQQIFSSAFYEHGAFLVAQTVKHLPAMQETWVWSLGQEDPLEKEMATHCSTVAWKIPWTEDPGRLQSMGSQRVRHNWATSLHFTSGGSASKESACNVADLGLIPGLGRSPGEGNGNPLQYSCLENPTDRGSW